MKLGSRESVVALVISMIEECVFRCAAIAYRHISLGDRLLEDDATFQLQ